MHHRFYMRSAIPMSSHTHGNDQNQNDELDHEPSLDQLFTVLANERRRRLLTYLHEKDGEVTSLDTLIDYLVVQEADSTEDLETDDVTISLYHKHLPRLADAGLIEYDLRSRTIRYREQPLIEKYLHTTARIELA